MSERLAITPTLFETDPSGHETFVSLEVVVDSKPFAGASDCVVLERDLLAFLGELDELAATSRGEASLRGGWGDSEHVRLLVRPRDSLGHLEVSVMLREHDPSSNFRVEGSFQLDPIEIAEFATAVRRVLRKRSLERIVL